MSMAAADALAQSLTGRDRRKDRRRLRRLDACLSLLEDAHERDEVMVPAGVAEMLHRDVPAIAPGMMIADAIELVLRRQEPYLVAAADGTDGSRPIRPVSPYTLEHLRCRLAPLDNANRNSHAALGEAEPTVRVTGKGGSSQGEAMNFEPQVVPSAAETSIAPLDENEARALTERIRTAAGQVCLLLLEAHIRRAWSALGYATWEVYVRSEFDLSRSRSYELLDQARVIRAIEAAAGVSGIPDISAFAAEEIKPRLPEITDAVRLHTAGLTPQKVREFVGRVVQQERWAIAAQRRGRRNGVGVVDDGAVGRRLGSSDLCGLIDAIKTLACMPAVEEVIAQLSEADRRRLRDVARAARWLSDFDAALTSEPAAARSAV